jgi:hypothetical protein
MFVPAVVRKLKGEKPEKSSSSSNTSGGLAKSMSGESRPKRNDSGRAEGKTDDLHELIVLREGTCAYNMPDLTFLTDMEQHSFQEDQVVATRAY